MANSKADHNIVMFRLAPDQLTKLAQLLKRDPIAGVKSHNQFARKIVKDFMNGRLAYTNKKDRYADSDLLDPDSAAG